MSKRKTGLGTDAFFQQPDSAEEEHPVEQKGSGQSQHTQHRVGKVRTTVTLYPETLAGMEMLKVQARLEGEKSTYSDILNEAVQDLMAKKGVKLPS